MKRGFPVPLVVGGPVSPPPRAAPRVAGTRMGAQAPDFRRRRMGRFTAVVVVAGCAALCAGALPVTAQTLQPRQVLDAVGIDQRLGAQLPMDLPFRDARGRAVTLAELFGERPVIVVPVYYECPMLCGETLRGLVGTLRTLELDLGADFDVVTVSIDAGETPAMAAASEADQLQRYGRDAARSAAGWHALVGDAEAVAALTERLGFRYLYDPQRDEYAHVSGIIVATPNGRVARYHYGFAYSGRDLRLSLVDASQGSIGTLADQVLLLCYHYDPVTGRYGLLIQTVLRLLGLAVVTGLAGLIAALLYRERRAGAAAGGPGDG